MQTCFPTQSASSDPGRVRPDRGGRTPGALQEAEARFRLVPGVRLR